MPVAAFNPLTGMPLNPQGPGSLRDFAIAESKKLLADTGPGGDLAAKRRQEEERRRQWDEEEQRRKQEEMDRRQQWDEEQQQREASSGAGPAPGATRPRTDFWP